MKRILVASVFAIPVLAQPALSNNWTGAYGGINLGYGWGNSDASYEEGGGNVFVFGDPCGLGPQSVTDQVVCERAIPQELNLSGQSLIDGVDIGSFDADGVLLGATFGINQQFGNWVFGIEADVMHLGLNENYSNVPVNTNSTDKLSTASISLPEGYELNIDSGLGVFASFRAGYSFNDDNTMIYGKAGYGGADLGINVGLSCTVLEICGSNWSDNFTEAFIFGAGIEHMINKTMSVKLEYLRMEFDDTLAVAQVGQDYDAFDFDFSVDTVRVGLNFKIGSPL